MANLSTAHHRYRPFHIFHINHQPPEAQTTKRKVPKQPNHQNPHNSPDRNHHRDIPSKPYTSPRTEQNQRTQVATRVQSERAPRAGDHGASCSTVAAPSGSRRPFPLASGGPIATRSATRRRFPARNGRGTPAARGNGRHRAGRRGQRPARRPDAGHPGWAPDRVLQQLWHAAGMGANFEFSEPAAGKTLATSGGWLRAVACLVLYFYLFLIGESVRDRLRGSLWSLVYLWVIVVVAIWSAFGRKRDKKCFRRLSVKKESRTCCVCVCIFFLFFWFFT